MNTNEIRNTGSTNPSTIQLSQPSKSNDMGQAIYDKAVEAFNAYIKDPKNTELNTSKEYQVKITIQLSNKSTKVHNIYVGKDVVNDPVLKGESFEKRIKDIIDYYYLMPGSIQIMSMGLEIKPSKGVIFK